MSKESIKKPPKADNRFGPQQDYLIYKFNSKI